MYYGELNNPQRVVPKKDEPPPPGRPGWPYTYHEVEVGEYRWADWLLPAGDAIAWFFKGEDYDCKTSSFVASARAYVENNPQFGGVRLTVFTPNGAEYDNEGDPDRVLLTTD